jgi:hypothetical protein
LGGSDSGPAVRFRNGNPKTGHPAAWQFPRNQIKAFCTNSFHFEKSALQMQTF